MQFLICNGTLVEAGAAAVKVTDHSYRYGDGLFETMKVVEGRIALAPLHFERLWHGISELKLSLPAKISPQLLENEIHELCRKNNCELAARVRLSVSGGEGGLYDGDWQVRYVIECWPLTSAGNELNQQGLIIDVYPDARKSCDKFSNLKSASHLPYAMAARFAKDRNWDDCLLLNSFNRICDSTIANIFWIKEGRVFTPPLAEGCIAGVMRKHLIEKLKPTRFAVQEKSCEIGDLESAKEIFLTNAIRGIRWVAKFRGRSVTNSIIRRIISGEM